MRNFGVRLLLGAVLLVSVAPLPAQRPFSGAAEIEESLHKLNELGTMLHIAAHPDDERTAVLAYFARGRHMRTAYLSLTRGEGGQNLIGSEQGAQLGIIRTQELLAARQIDGAEQFFTRAIDFGFTRTADETLQKWGHDRILSDMVWVIRRYRPDVILLGFSGTPRDGHGQHQASAILGKEAFTAAADPKMFPEQLKYVQVWQAKRLAQAAGFGGFGLAVGGGGGGGRGGAPAVPPGVVPPVPETETGPDADTGSFNPILGYSYEELAVLSRSMHHSQGTGAMRRPGAGPRRLHDYRRRARHQGSVRRHRHLVEPSARRRRGQGHPGRGDSELRAGASRKGDSGAGQGAPADRRDRGSAGQGETRRTR